MKDKYDITIILRPDLKEDGKEESVKKYEKLVKALGGVPGKIVEMGKKQLAYKIKSKSEGVYFSLEVEMPASGVVELEKKLAVDNDILRHLLVRV
jgi:small subunit ribosomal protein S6